MAGAVSVARTLIAAGAGVFAAFAAVAEMFPFLIRPEDACNSAADVSAWVKAPAGRDGFLRREGEKFVNDAGELRLNGVNLTGAANFPSHTEADRLAPQLRRLGINCVRTHLIDWVAYSNAFQDPQHCLFRKDVPGMSEVDPKQLDRFLYLVAALKRNGIYVNLNLHAGRQLGPDDGYPKTCWANRGVDFFNGRLIAAEKEFARMLLGHENPYTGLALKDDPAMALIELNNENALMQVWWSKTLVNQQADPCYTEEFLRLRKEAGYGESVEDTNRFIIETEKAYFRGMKEFLVKELGVKCPIYGTQLDYTAPWVMADTCDAIDAHIYWGHPHWKLPKGVDEHSGRAREVEWRFRNCSIADAKLSGDYGNPIVTRGSRRVKGLPFISSECSSPYPAWYGSEFQPMIHAYAAFQGWAGLFVYSWNNAEEAFPDHNPFFFSYTARPDCLAHFPASAAMFLKGGVKGAKERIDIPVDREARLHSVTNENYYNLVVVSPGSETKGVVPDAAFLEHAVAVELGPSGEMSPRPDCGHGSTECARTYASDTNEIFLDWTPDSNCVFRVDAPNVKFVSGHIDGKRIRFRDGIVIEPGQTEHNWCAVSVTAVDGKGFKPGARLLVAATGFTHNGGAKYTKLNGVEWGGKGVKELGEGPMVTEGVPVKLTLPFEAMGHPLDGAGSPRSGETLRGTEFALGPAYRTIWYEFQLK